MLIVVTTGYSIFYVVIIKDLPHPDDLVNRNQEVSTKIYDRNGILLYTIYKDKNRSIVPLSDIPVYIQIATLAAEDADFYNHPGFSIRGMTRAFFKNIREQKVTGGSTITQQLVKNTLLSPEKTITRKLKEIVLSIEVERNFTKDEILEMYLNEVSYGGTAYGIQEASRLYFGKDIDKLGLGEAALLVGLTKSPTKYSPFGTSPELAKSRQEEVLDLMVAHNFIAPELAERAKNEQIKFAANTTDIKAPHFVMYVKQLLVDKYGEDVVGRGGLQVTTTLDYNIQKMAEAAVKDEIDKLSDLHITNGASVVLDPKTGEILAMVGSKDYFNSTEDGQVNVTTRLQQPGSSIKVINYAYALSNGYTPATIIDDSPITFNIDGQKPYTPKNYDGKYRGKITLRSALAESRNIPAVKVLNSYGVDKMLDLGKKMGITTWTNPYNYGLSLTLGGGDVRLLDLAQVYATIANYGYKPELRSITKITNPKGKVLYTNNCGEVSEESRFNIAHLNCQQKVLNESVAYMLTDILKDNNARAPAFGTHSALVVPGHAEVAVKTGTSNDMRDNLTIGYNQKYLVAVWVGNNDNSPMSRVASGVTGASPIWNKIMTNLIADSSNHNWVNPSELVEVEICSFTGTLPCNGCPTKKEWFQKDKIPTDHCKLDQLSRSDSNP